MTLTIYGKVHSRAARCLWVLEELGLPYAHVPTDPLAGDTRAAAFLALNPAGKIPVLVDGDLVLSESLAIADYLVDLHPEALAPVAPRARAIVRQWSVWAGAEFEPPVTRLVRAKRAGAEPPADAVQDIAALLALVERQLAHGHAHMLGAGFTLADINVAGAVMVAPLVADIAPFPNTAGWLGRVLARDAWRRVQGRA